MIIDADTHISSQKEGIKISGEQLISNMDRLGIEKSLIWLHPNQAIDEYCDFDEENKYIYEMSQKYPDRFLPVGWINPAKYSYEETVKQADIQINEYGFKAIKFNGAQNFYSLNDEKLLYPIMDYVVKKRARLAFHCGDDDNTNPDRINVIAKKYKNVKILLVHMGQTLCDDAIRVASENSNILMIGSGMSDRSFVLKAVKTLGSKRVAFGSDTPFFDASTVLDEYKELFKDDLTEQEIKDVFYDNILNYFK